MGLKHGGWNKTQKILLNLLPTKGSEVLHAAIYDYLDFFKSERKFVGTPKQNHIYSMTQTKCIH